MNQEVIGEQIFKTKQVKYNQSVTKDSFIKYLQNSIGESTSYHENIEQEV